MRHIFARALWFSRPAGRTVDLVRDPPRWSSSQVLYRLASYADQRYREIVAVLQSPAHVKRMSVVGVKRREAEGIRAKRGEGKDSYRC